MIALTGGSPGKAGGNFETYCRFDAGGRFEVGGHFEAGDSLPKGGDIRQRYLTW
jgi:hypothetical protein